MTQILRTSHWVAVVFLAVFVLYSSGSPPSQAEAASSKEGHTNTEKKDPASLSAEEGVLKDLDAAESLGKGTPIVNFWIGPEGAFHLTGFIGKGIYQFSGFFDTKWAFVDALPVGNRVGWTYVELDTNGFPVSFFMFFSNDGGNGPCPPDKFELLWSSDNANFNHFDCTD